MMRSSIGKTLAANRQRKSAVGSKAMPGIKSLQTKIPGGTAAAMKKGGSVKEVWEKSRPKDLGKPKALSSSQKASAKAAAQKAGRKYPNLVDNMRAARKK